MGNQSNTLRAMDVLMPHFISPILKALSLFLMTYVQALNRTYVFNRRLRWGFINTTMVSKERQSFALTTNRSSEALLIWRSTWWNNKYTLHAASRNSICIRSVDTFEIRVPSVEPFTVCFTQIQNYFTKHSEYVSSSK